MLETASVSAQAAAWAVGLRFGDLPEDLVAATRLRLLDMLGLSLSASAQDFGRGMRGAALALSGGAAGPARLIGFGDALPPVWAAFVNGAMAQAQQFDDTFSEAVIHPTSPNAAVALALGETLSVRGETLIAAMAAGIELACRIGVVAPSQFLRRGMHPTSIMGTMAATFTAGKLLGLDAGKVTAALGHAGSFAGGLVECWTDGTDTQYVHPGWCAHNGIAAAQLAANGVLGPAQVLEGRYGLFPTHIQNSAVEFDFARMLDRLGSHWESRRISFKPYPTAHTVHAFLDALLTLVREHAVRWQEVERVRVRIAEYMIPFYCEPPAEKLRPRTAPQARVSVQYSLAEALYFGRLAGDGYAPESLTNPDILGLADRMVVEVDPDAPGTERFKGWIVIEMRDGRRLERVEEHNRGSAENPMSVEDILAKFRDNAGRMLSPDRTEAVIAEVGKLESLPDLQRLMDLCITDLQAG